MGIDKLASYVLKNCKNEVHLRDFGGKCFAVDFMGLLNMFLYRKKGCWYLLEFINLIHKLKRYYIDILFVFDGKPGIEKQHTLTLRKTYRDNLSIKRDALLANKEYIDKVEYDNALEYFNKKIFKVNSYHIQNCKKLFDILCVNYIHIDNIEADMIFKYLLDTKIADAVFSEDTDMIARGCHTVLKNLNHTTDILLCIEYSALLEHIQLTPEQFTNACILAGNDYNDGVKYTKEDKMLLQLENKCKFADNIDMIKKYKNIDCVIANLNNRIPTRFDWQNTIAIFSEDISFDAKEYIHCKMDKFKNYKEELKQSKDIQFIQKKDIIDFLLYEMFTLEQYYKDKYIFKATEFIKWNNEII